MLKGFNKNHHELISWSVSDRLVETNMVDILDTAYVVVDGKELSWVMNSYMNLPHHRTCEPQIWTGDIARFIVGHLPTEDYPDLAG
jgi:hypothetical protein